MKMFERSNGCRNSRREIEEAGQDETLSLATRSHLRACGQCEIFFDQQLKLRQIVSSLGTIAAPNDFEFRLRARLAGEKRNASQPVELRNYSFGLRAAAFASILLLVGFALLTFGLRPGTNGPVGGDSAQVGPTPAMAQPVSPGSSSTVTAKIGNEPAARPSAVSDGVNLKGTNQRAANRNLSRGGQPTTVGSRGRSVDMLSRGAGVVRTDQLVAAGGHTVFPIDAAPQALRVSLDNGKGTPKTVSVPGVSFGSQRVLSQNPSPLMASSRGAW